MAIPPWASLPHSCEVDIFDLGNQGDKVDTNKLNNFLENQHKKFSDEKPYYSYGNKCFYVDDYDVDRGYYYL